MRFPDVFSFQQTLALSLTPLLCPSDGLDFWELAGWAEGCESPGHAYVRLRQNLAWLDSSRAWIGLSNCWMLPEGVTKECKFTYHSSSKGFQARMLPRFQRFSSVPMFALLFCRVRSISLELRATSLVHFLFTVKDENVRLICKEFSRI